MKEITMGLNCSHNAFSGSYTSFNKLRQKVCRAMNGSYPPHYTYFNDGSLAKDSHGYLVIDQSMDENLWYWGDGYDESTHPGLKEFLSHSDCDGEISPEMCINVANELEALIPKLKQLEGFSEDHVVMPWQTIGVLQRFIDGCRAAAVANEQLIFE
jgi:hypothetical protein